MDKVEPEMGDDLPSQYLVDQNDSTVPEVVAGKPQSKRPNLSGIADDIGFAVRLRELLRGRKHWTTSSSTWARNSGQG